MRPIKSISMGVLAGNSEIAFNFETAMYGIDRNMPFILESVDGLGGPEWDTRMVKNGNNASTYQGRNYENIVLTFTYRLNPYYINVAHGYGNTSYGRDMIYQNVVGSPRTYQNYSEVISVKITLRDNSVWYIDGVISKIETNHFEKEPRIVVEFTALTSYWYKLPEDFAVTISEANRTSASFPYGANSQINTDFRIQIKVNAASAKYLIVSMVNQGDVFQATYPLLVVRNFTFAVNDLINIDTKARNVTITRSGNTTPLTTYLAFPDRYSRWPEAIGGLDYQQGYVVLKDTDPMTNNTDVSTTIARRIESFVTLPRMRGV